MVSKSYLRRSVVDTGCHCALDTLGHDHAAAVVQRDVSDVEVVEVVDLDRGPFPLRGGVREIVIEGVVWEVD